MKAIFLFIIFTLNVHFFPNAYSQLPQDSINANIILNKAIEALGGKEYLQSVKTLYTDTKTTMDGREVH